LLGHRTRTPRGWRTGGQVVAESVCLITPIDGRWVRKRSSLRAGHLAASATQILKAWMDRPCHSPAVVIDNQDGEEAVLTSAFSSGPVGDRVELVGHSLGLPVRRGDGAAVKVTRTARWAGKLDAELPFSLKRIRQGAAVAEPADPAGSPWKCTFLCLHDPPGQDSLREQVEDGRSVRRVGRAPDRPRPQRERALGPRRNNGRVGRNEHGN